MLVLRRSEGQWIRITHDQSGDILEFRVYDLSGTPPGRAHLAFDDAPRNFRINRIDRPPGPIRRRVATNFA